MTCPKCKSENIEVKSTAYMILSWLGFIPLVAFLFLIFTPLGIIAGIAALIAPLAVISKRMVRCRDCKKTWFADKSQLEIQG
jgi:hypothetical protein